MNRTQKQNTFIVAGLVIAAYGYYKYSNQPLGFNYDKKDAQIVVAGGIIVLVGVMAKLLN